MVPSASCGSVMRIADKILSNKSSTSLLSVNHPFCRICHLIDNAPCNPMITPCRCSGTMQFVHIACLVHWLELSSRNMSSKPFCELCGYYYKRHSFFNIKETHFPRINNCDIIFNIIFLFVIIIMVICVFVCVHFMVVNEYNRSLRPYRSHTMTNEDFTIITCSAVFFAAFFIAVFTQYKAEISFIGLISRFWQINRNWQIKNYQINQDLDGLKEKSKSSLLCNASTTEQCVIFQ
ncbi:unnamed protein product [Dracunculus medinensis]|uniref:RING-CH-type domain-containing protein n=1 Tax=Dracunculus medinensis TaxID=318479 RepID=A0A158Q5E3_DRAME|nr:unnamed protein product [Dracunculus medinensis]